MKLICTQGYKDIYKKGEVYNFGEYGIGPEGTRIPFSDGVALFKPLRLGEEKNEIEGCPGVTYSYDEEDCCLSFHFDGKEVICWSVDDSDFIDGMIEDFRTIYKLGQGVTDSLNGR